MKISKGNKICISITIAVSCIIIVSTTTGATLVIRNMNREKNSTLTNKIESQKPKSKIIKFKKTKPQRKDYFSQKELIDFMKKVLAIFVEGLWLRAFKGHPHREFLQKKLKV